LVKFVVMDISAQIKDSLISRIKASKDLNFLRALQTIFDSSDQALYELNDEQKKSIEIGQAQIKEGKFVSHDQVMSEMKEWLSKK
jgi:predicted transcriptional regulator